MKEIKIDKLKCNEINQSVLIQDINNINTSSLNDVEEFYLIDFKDKDYLDILINKINSSEDINIEYTRRKLSNLALILITPYQHLIERARSLGIYVIAIWDKHPLLMNSLNNDVLANEYYVFDINDTKKLDSMISFIISNNEIDYIYNIGREEIMTKTFEIAEKYNKSLNSSKSIQFINDKYQMRKLLEKNKLSTLKYKYVNSLNDIYQSINGFDFPFIIKPTALSGSTGVYLCRNEKGIEEWINLIRSYDYSGPFLIEEYLEGREVSVETISLNSNHYIYGITDKYKSAPPFFVELGHVHPSQLPKDTIEAIKNLVKDFLNCANYTFGPSHTEVIVTNEGPKIVESQARFGGDSIPRLVQLSTGNDMYNDIFEILLTDKAPNINQPQKVASVHSLQLPSGIVSKVEGLQEILKMPNVDQIVTPKIGEKINTIKNSASRSGFFIVSGKSEKETAEYVKQVNKKLRIEIKE